MQIKPKEIYTMKYWIHVLVISTIVLALLQLFKGGEMFTIKNVLWSVPLIGAADIIAHSLLGLD